MKKIISIITMITIICLLILTGNIYATPLDSVTVNTDKTTIKPGSEVKVSIEFGTQLGAYTFDIAYDNNIFEYISVEGGIANDTTDKVRVTFHDSTGGTNPRTNMIATFKAKADITTSNPTEFTVTGEGLANADASINYDDINIPIVKNVTVEPEYVDYTLKLEHTGDIIKGKEKEMTLSYSSPMGRYYEHARLVAEASTPKGATVKLIGTDQSNLQHDIIQSGWGDAQGYKIGGKDVNQTLKVNSLFSEAGEYKITLKLIDRDKSDSIIAEKTFDFTVKEEITSPEQPTKPTPPETEQNEQTKPETIVPPKEETVPKEEEKPSSLPKTGMNIYIQILAYFTVLMVLIVAIKMKNKTKR